MCGIFGLILERDHGWEKKTIHALMTSLFSLSERRGRDASGISFVEGSSAITLKRPMSASRLMKTDEFRALIQNSFPESQTPLLIVGQSRLMTSGSVQRDDNNQPITAGEITGVHNGILTNFINEDDVSDSMRMFQELNSRYIVSGNPKKAFEEVFGSATGSASLCASFRDQQKIILASNTGSLHYLQVGKNSLIFSSEASMLRTIIKKHEFLRKKNPAIVQLKAGEALLLDQKTESSEKFSFQTASVLKSELPARISSPSRPAESISAALKIHRCKKCVLPSTYPFINFDSDGICNFCKRYSPQKVHGEEALLRLLDRYRSRDGSPDCLVGLSGGRDSCYGLHLLKTKYGMNPIAYTFDWGLTTDTSRRNQARICGKLGIEHIIRSPDIEKKRAHVRQNVKAFLKRPHLGMVPLFMAGDKEFYEYGRRLRKENNLNLTVFCAGHSLEQRDFMTGFCGVDEDIANNKRLYKFSLVNKIRLASFYASQYLLNPSYINSSLGDSLRSFLYTFLYRDDFLYLFEYLPWEEKRIEDVLKREYGWEADHGYGKNQWRMGDGQTAFTNYIYYTVAGFSEFDNFRSNQIREGMISREEALVLIEKDNQLKKESFHDFCSVIGLDEDETLEKIRQIPKLYV